MRRRLALPGLRPTELADCPVDRRRVRLRARTPCARCVRTQYCLSALQPRTHRHRHCHSPASSSAAPRHKKKTSGDPELERGEPRAAAAEGPELPQPARPLPSTRPQRGVTIIVLRHGATGRPWASSLGHCHSGMCMCMEGASLTRHRGWPRGTAAAARQHAQEERAPRHGQHQHQRRAERRSPTQHGGGPAGGELFLLRDAPLESFLS